MRERFRVRPAKHQQYPWYRCPFLARIALSLFQSQCNHDNAAALDIINTVRSMPYNLVSAVSRHLTPEVVVNIASASSLDGSGTQSAVKAAVPAILSALVNVAETPPGARKLTRAAADQPKGFLKDLTNQRRDPSRQRRKEAPCWRRCWVLARPASWGRRCASSSVSVQDQCGP